MTDLRAHLRALLDAIEEEEGNHEGPLLPPNDGCTVCTFGVRNSGKLCVRHAAEEALRERSEAATARIAVCGGGECGICSIDVPDEIDSGATFLCVRCGGSIVFDVASPEARAEMFSRLAPRREEEIK